MIQRWSPFGQRSCPRTGVTVLGRSALAINRRHSRSLSSIVLCVPMTGRRADEDRPSGGTAHGSSVLATARPSRLSRAYPRWSSSGPGTTRLSPSDPADVRSANGQCSEGRPRPLAPWHRHEGSRMTMRSRDLSKYFGLGTNPSETDRRKDAQRPILLPNQKFFVQKSDRSRCSVSDSVPHVSL